LLPLGKDLQNDGRGRIGGGLGNVSIMPEKRYAFVGIQTWSHAPGLWIPAFAGVAHQRISFEGRE
jgi:hypothetical protein